ncbi:hypothetical protein WR25_09952 [Diploscapter pachys]|uniref:TonB-dependent receptor plug domain-containing protein n=1 Tax=Diploscapter pachys TaxID=2018661 RepID=A0A2A2K5J6_9BILA|nr:hypothetical protein WR25_09952 [Diploscapter pachys]
MPRWDAHAARYASPLGVFVSSREPKLLRRQLHQCAIVAIAQHPERAVRSFLHLARAAAQPDAGDLACGVAGDADADQALLREAGEQEVAGPACERAPAILDHPARRDYRRPADQRRGISGVGAVARDGRAVVIVTLRHLGPAIVPARLDQVELVAARRSHFGFKQSPVAGDHEAVGVARPRRVLRGGELLALAGADEHRAPVGRKGDPPAQLPAGRRRRRAPHHRHVVEPRRAARHQRRARDGELLPAGRRLGIGQPDPRVVGEAGVEHDVLQPQLPRIGDARHARHLRLGAGLRDELQPSRLFGDERAPVGQERHRPGVVEAGDDALVHRRHGGCRRRRAGRAGGRRGRGAGGPAAAAILAAAQHQRRERDRQQMICPHGDTPIAISVLDDSALRNRHVQSLVDLQDGAIPSLRVAPFYSRNSALIVNIRGVGVLADSNQPARDQGVGVYIDGVYLGRGALNIVTKKPTGEFGFNGTAGIGNYGSYKGEAHLDLPAFANIAVKLDGIVTSRGGLVKNPMSGQADFNAFDRRGFHGEALWKPVTGFSADYAFDTSRPASAPPTSACRSSPASARRTAIA